MVGFTGLAFTKQTQHITGPKSGAHAGKAAARKGRFTVSVLLAPSLESEPVRFDGTFK